MSTVLSATKTDLLRSKLVEPGIYPAVIKSVQQKPGVKDPSTVNTVFTFHIVGGAYDGVPIDFLIPEKAPGFGQELITILQGKPWEGEPVDVDNAVGKKMRIHVINDVYNGRKNNKIDGFLPLNS